MFRRNTYLWSVIVIGAIVTTVGGTGIFAVFADRATQGPNTVQSGPRPRAADLQIGQMVAGICSGLQDDLTTALWNLTSMQPGDTVQREFCLKNNGSANVTVSLTALDLVESDPQCTGDEQSVDPPCGGGLGQGQLANLLQVDFSTDNDCDSTYGQPGDTSGTSGLFALQGNPAVVRTGLVAGSMGCVALNVLYPSTTSLESAQAAQSDSVSWKFAFDAVAIE